MRRGDATPAELGELYRRRFDHFVRVAVAICGDGEAGRDVVQLAFATAIRRRRSFRGDGPLEAWVWRIVVNEARRAARAPRDGSIESLSLERDTNGRSDDPYGVRALVAGLPGRQREVLFLRYYADLEYHAIADVLEIEPGTVAATLSAAHQTLRRRLGGFVDDRRRRHSARRAAPHAGRRRHARLGGGTRRGRTRARAPAPTSALGNRCCRSRRSCGCRAGDASWARDRAGTRRVFDVAERRTRQACLRGGAACVRRQESIVARLPGRNRASATDHARDRRYERRAAGFPLGLQPSLPAPERFRAAPRDDAQVCSARRAPPRGWTGACTDRRRACRHGKKFAWYGLDRFHSAKLQITTGIAADGVDGVVLHDDHGRHEVGVESNAFVYVAEEPEVGQRVKQVWARTATGLVAVPFAPIPTAFGSRSRSMPAPPAPAVERKLKDGRIGWLDRREERGEPLSVLPTRTRATVLGRRARTNVLFGRVLTPDPQQPLRVVLTLNGHRPGGSVAGLCQWLVMREGTSGGCSPYPELFERSPLAMGVSGGGTGAFVTVEGFVSDDVAHVEATMASRERVDVALTDNVFAVDLARAKLPARLVAYDSERRVVAVSDPLRDFGDGAGPARGRAKLLVRAEGPGRSYAELSVGPSNQGGTCEYIKHFVDRQHTGVGVSCRGATWTGPPVQVYSQFQPVRFIGGRVRDDVAAVRIRFADGTTVTVRPKRGHVLYAVPAERLTEAHRAVGADGLDEAGRVVERTSFEPPRPRTG